jgi:hypothetical protein
MRQPPAFRMATQSLRRCAAAILAVAAVLVGPTAGQAQAGPDSVSIFVDCIYLRADGSWAALFGYKSPGNNWVNVPLGPDNRLVGAVNSGQPPTDFVPGRHSPAFVVDIPASTPTVLWHLRSDGAAKTTTAGKAFTQVCASDPVPFSGSTPVGVAMLTVAGLGVGGVLTKRRTRNRHGSR